MHICILSDGFPSEGRPSFVFVEQLVIALADRGIKVSVIAPQSLTKSLLRGIPLLPKETTSIISKGQVYKVYRPWTISFGNYSFLQKLVKLSKSFALKRTMNKIGVKNIDVLYGHFWHNGYALMPIAQRYSKPLFVACGEGDNALENLVASLSQSQLNNLKQTVNGCISSSSENKKKSIKLGLIDEKDIVVFPNSVNKDLFHPYDKMKCRMHLGINSGDFVVAFVGGFIHRKGSQRLAEAIKRINNPRLKSIFIGKPMEGDDYTPECPGIIYRGALSHNDIPTYLSAADVFVLPTLKEGCCNAIVEAQSCGLPIISSKDAFNDDIINDKTSIRIDPNSVDEIEDALVKLMANPERLQKMSQAAVEFTDDLSIVKRAEKIHHFILKQIELYRI